MAPPDSDLTAEHDKVARLREQLRIGEDDLLRESYSDLLLDSPERLLAAAEEAMQNAYAPYSNFKVGAALRSPTGSIYAGANVENASYPQGQCAETSAIGALVTAGDNEISAVAVVAERMDFCPPCGGCRQRLSEFGRADTPVYLGRPGGPRRETTPGRAAPAGVRAGAFMSWREAARVMEQRAGLRPRVGVVLGSGLGAVADSVEDPMVIGYDELPGFPRPGVEGHGGRAVLGRIAGVPVALLQGRAHLYEGGDREALRVPVRALFAAGAELLVLTNAAGSLRPEVGPGRLMAISDHINLSGTNILAGPNDDELGPRFPGLRDAYDRAAARPSCTPPPGSSA